MDGAPRGQAARFERRALSTAIVQPLVVASPFELTALRRRLLVRHTAASAITLAVVISYYQLIGPIISGRSRSLVVAQNVAMAVAGIAVGTSILRQVLVSRFEPEWAEVTTGAPSADVRDRLLGQPLRLSCLVLGLWSVPALLAPVDDVTARHFRAAGAEFVGILLAALGLAAATYLIVERLLRPLFGIALAGAPTGAHAPGVRQRFVVGWLLGSAVPLVGISLTPVVRTGPIHPTAAMVFLAVAGLAVGAVMSLAMARSVSEPLDGVVATMARVETGDFDVDVVVDNTAEVGRVQAGLRAMVAGLRQRRDLEDLFGRHVGADVAREALARGIALGGETREATIIFVDLVGSTATTVALDAREVVARTNRFFGAVVAVIADAGGWLHKFQGDGAVCVFGVPLVDAEHLANAARAALTLRDRVQELGFDAAIGVATGTVVAGNVGAETRLEYTVMGATVNLAARLCDSAKHHAQRVLLSGPEDAIRAVGWQDAGMFELRGFPNATRAWTA